MSILSAISKRFGPTRFKGRRRRVPMIKSFGRALDIHAKIPMYCPSLGEIRARGNKMRSKMMGKQAVKMKDLALTHLAFHLMMPCNVSRDPGRSVAWGRSALTAIHRATR